MISGRQISAARGLLQWSQADLARKVGLTPQTIRNLEAEARQPQEQTISLIANAFEKYGVEFTPDEGVRIKQNNYRVYSGKAEYRQLLDHIYATLKDGGRVRQFNFGDSRYLTYADEFLDEHLKRMSQIKGLDAKVLATEDEKNFAASYCEYRPLASHFRTIAPYYLYDDYVVLSLTDTVNKKEFLSIHSKLMAERYTAEFDTFWKLGSPAKKDKRP